jgi:hypothetical protein
MWIARTVTSGSSTAHSTAVPPAMPAATMGA